MNSEARSAIYDAVTAAQIKLCYAKAIGHAVEMAVASIERHNSEEHELRLECISGDLSMITTLTSAATHFIERASADVAAAESALDRLQQPSQPPAQRLA